LCHRQRLAARFVSIIFFGDKLKIIGFDSWTGGAHHFERLLPALEALSIQLTLVHIGSWGNEPGCSPERRINNLLTRDITFYGSDSFETVLDIERPDAVILLSTDTFAHRAFIRYCKLRSIPTLNLYHGLVNVQDAESGGVAYEMSRFAHAKYAFSKIGKLVRHTLPCYAKALLKTKADYSDWHRFMLDIIKMSVGKTSTIAADDAGTTKCAVYVPADVEHAVHWYGFKKEDVLVVGNPDFLHFGLKENMIGHWTIPPSNGMKTIMYIETGFASVGLFFAGAKDFSDHLIDSAQVLATYGYKLCVKLKPHQVEFNKSVSPSLEGAGIELVSNQDFLSKMMNCSACIVETTTVAVIPALVGMPLLLANFGNLKSLSFGSVLTSYPRAYLLQQISDVDAVLHEDVQVFNKDKLNNWLYLNAGPMPPEKMPDRVVAIVVEMISENMKGAIV
jgi:hypothetical protein